MTRVAKKYGWTVLAYCLMDNHYHLLISVGEKGLAGGMCELNSGYASTFNARHGRVNHLFGKRYWNRRIKTDASLWNVVRYIVQNPRAAGAAKTLEALSVDELRGDDRTGAGGHQARERRSAPVLRSRRSRRDRDVPLVLFGQWLREAPSGGSHRDVRVPAESRNCVLGAAAAFWWG